MKPIVLSLVMGVLVAAGTARALDYDQTLKLVEAKIGEQTLLSLLAVDKPTFFPTLDQVKELRAAGATDAVIRVLIGQPNPAARTATSVPAPAPVAATPVSSPVRSPSPPMRVEEVSAGQGAIQFENGDDRGFGVLLNEANGTIQLTAPNSALPSLPAGSSIRLPADRGDWTLSLFGGDYAAEVRVRNKGVTTIRLDPVGSGLRASVNDGERSRNFTLEADNSPAPAATAPAPSANTNVVVQPPQTNTVYVQSQPSTVVVEQPSTTYYYPSTNVVYGSPYYYYPNRYYYPSRSTVNLGFYWGGGSRWHGGGHRYGGGYRHGGRPPSPPRGGHGGRPGGGPHRGGRR